MNDVSTIENFFTRTKERVTSYTWQKHTYGEVSWSGCLAGLMGFRNSGALKSLSVADRGVHYDAFRFASAWLQRQNRFVGCSVEEFNDHPSTNLGTVHQLLDELALAWAARYPELTTVGEVKPPNPDIVFQPSMLWVASPPKKSQGWLTRFRSHNIPDSVPESWVQENSKEKVDA